MKKFRNYTNNQLCKAKKRHYENLLKQTDPRKQWIIINECINPSETQARIIDSVITEGGCATDTGRTGEEFSPFFVDIVPRLASAMPDSALDSPIQQREYSIHLPVLLLRTKEIIYIIHTLKNTSPEDDHVKASLDIVKSVSKHCFATAVPVI